MRNNILGKLSFLTLFLVIVLLPIFFLPFMSVPVEASKGLLLVVGLAISLILWSLARFFDGKIVLPRSSLILSSLGIVLIVLLSALFSSGREISLFGTLFDIGSFWFIFSGFLLMFLCAILIRTPRQAKMVLFGAVLSSAAVLVFQLAHLFWPNVLALGVMAGKTANPIGSWSSLGLFAGFSAMLFMLFAEFAPMSRLGKILMSCLIFLALILAAAVNYPLVWIMLGLGSLIVFVYKASANSTHADEAEVRHFPTTSFVLVIISLMFFISGQFIGNLVPNFFQIQNAEISPSFGATAEVAKGVLMRDPVLGIGPNRFLQAWAMYKPQSINISPLGGVWDIAFGTGAGLIPTFMSTTGILGILAWTIFFVLFLNAGIRSIFGSLRKGLNWELAALFLLALYLFAGAFFYSVDTTLWLLALALTGIFVGLTSEEKGGEITLMFLNDHRKSFFSMLLLILLVVSSAALSFKYMERLASVSYFRKALAAEAQETAEQNINKAVSLYQNDLYLRTYAQIYLFRLQTMAQKNASLSEAEKKVLEESFKQALNSAKLAVAYNGSNYLNYQLLGSVYITVGRLGVEGAYPNAALAYEKAVELNPLNPGLRLSLANVSFLEGKLKPAKVHAEKALELKPDYAEALLVLSQIARREGNNTLALQYAERALTLAPDSKSIAEYVSSLKNGAASENKNTNSTE